MVHDTSLAGLRASLQGLHDRQLSVDGFCQLWRNASALLAALPPRYRQVMEDLLGRLEASRWFAEESCSFSQDDLIAQLGTWLDKAGQTLSVAAPQ